MSTIGLSSWTFLQNISLLGKFHIPWSPPLQSVVDWALFVMMDLERLRERVVILNEWRVQFTFICVCAPLCIGFIALILCYEPAEVVLYFTFFGFICVAISGIVAMQFGTTAIFGSNANRTNIIVGAVGAGVTLIAYLALFRYFRKARRRQTIYYASVDDRCYEETKRLRKMSTVFKIVAILILCIGGAGLAGWTGTWDVLMRAYQWGSFLLTVGYIMFGLGCLVFIYLLVTLGHKGRMVIWRVKWFLQRNFIKLLLLISAVLYLPIVSNTLDVFNCAEVTCPLNTRFPDDIGYPYSTGRLDICQNCTFRTYNFTDNTLINGTIYPTLASTLCPGETGRRLRVNYSIECVSIMRFFWPATIIMAVAFAIGIPVLFYVLIHKQSRSLRRYPLDPDHSSGLTGNQKWRDTMLLSQNVGMSLCAPFQYQWRYWRLIDLLYRLAVLLITMFLSNATLLESGFLAIVVIAGLHSLMFLCLLMLQPHSHKLERGLACLVQGIMVVNYAIAACLVGKAFTSDQAAIPLIILLILNLVCVVAGLVLIVLLLMDQNKRRVAAAGPDAETLRRRRSSTPAPIAVAPVPSAARSITPPPAPGAAAETSLTQPASLPADPGNQPSAGGETGGGEGSGGETPAESQQPIATTSSNANASGTGIEAPALPSPAAEENNLMWATPATNPQDEILRERLNIDYQIDQSTRRSIARFFLFSCILAFASLACCLSGIMYGVYSTSVIPSRPYQSEASRQLLGYANWAHFTSNCGCMDASLASSPLSEERWVCANGWVVFHRREEKDPSDGVVRNGRDLVRPFCSTAFHTNCSLAVVSATQTVQVTCAMSVPAFVLTQLW